MRYWARRPFFFNDTDNTAALTWTTNVIVTQGTTIQATPAGGVLSMMVALNAGTTGAVLPTWPTVQFTIPATTQSPPPLPPPVSGTAGTVVDNAGPNQIIWANNGPIVGGFAANSQLSTVYNVNQYTMPIDLIAFTRVEVSWALNIRLEMEPKDYGTFRDWDVIRPSPPATYPTYYCWYKQTLYLWPYPGGIYPITLSYRGSPPVATLTTTSNIWTTQAEAMVRHYAEARICEAVIGDPAMAQMYDNLAQQEFIQLQQEQAQQLVREPITPSPW